MKPAPAILRAWAKAARKTGLPVDLSKPPSAAWARARMKQTAYHESGHVAAAAFTGCEFSHITVVSIIPAVGKGSGCVWRQNTMEGNMDIYPPKIARGVGLRYMIGHLAGQAAEFRVQPSLDIDELSEARKEPGNDLFRADKMAALLARRNVSATRILWLARDWTEEMLNFPQVWLSVKTMAALLLTNGEIRQGPELYGIFQPIMDLSLRLPKWYRRLWPKGGDPMGKK